MTQPDFVAIVRSRLSDEAKASPEKRQKLYQSLRHVLETRFGGEGRVQGDIAMARRALEAAIATVERECLENQRTAHALSEVLALAEHEMEPTRLDRWVHSVTNLATGFKAKYGILAGIASFIGDFIKPILDMTQPVMIGSGIAGVGLYALSRMTRTSRGNVLTAAGFSAALCICSTGWFTLQTFVPGAKAKGAVAQLVPGASAVQDAVVASLGRIEGQTKRIADTLDAESQRNREREENSRKEAELQMQKFRDGQKKEITDAGYSLDAAGLMKGIQDGFTKQYLYGLLGIKPTKEALFAAAPGFDNDMQVIRLASFVATERDNYSFVREIAAKMLEDRTHLAAAFQASGAQRVLCDPKSYSLQINAKGLEAICRTTGLRFAAGYLRYFVVTYGNLPSDEPAPRLTAADFMKNSPGELPIAARLDRIVFANMKECEYYEGPLEYFFIAGLSPWGSFQNGNLASSIRYFDVNDRAFGKDTSRCHMMEIASGRQRQCRERVIMASSCLGYKSTVIKALAGPSQAPQAAGEQHGAAAGQPAAHPDAATVRANSALTAAEVRAQIIGTGKTVNHNGQLDLTYGPNGKYDGGDGRIGTNGTYRVEQDGRVCWKNDRGFSGCFQYYRQNGALFVRRNDPGNTGIIGPVKISSR